MNDFFMSSRMWKLQKVKVYTVEMKRILKLLNSSRFAIYLLLIMRVGVIRDEKAVLDYVVERIHNTYPVYTLDCREKQQKAFELMGTYENVKLLGRTGSFWYNNMDHSILAAISLFRESTSTARQENV